MNLYLIKRSGNGETFLKVGITSYENTSKRHNFEKTKVADADLPLPEKLRLTLNGEEYLHDDSYPEIERLLELSFSHEGQAKFLEKMVLDAFKSIQYIPSLKYSGKTECFIFTKQNKNDIVTYIKKQAKSIKLDRYDELRYQMLLAKIRDSDPINRHLKVMQKIMEARDRAEGSNSGIPRIAPNG